jgi:hypothetical protein
MQQKLTEKTELDFFHEKLVEAGWDFYHPRIQNYIKRVEEKIKRPLRSPEALPKQTLIRLCVLIYIYLRVEELLKDNLYTWEDDDIKHYFNKYGDGEVMTIQGWKELQDFLDVIAF